MTRPRFVPAVLAFTALAAGCALRSAPPWVVAGAQPLAAAQPEAAETLFDPVRSWSGKVTIAAAQRPDVPHAGLQLPRVSPDGKWIASLQSVAPDGGAFDLTSLIDGDGLDGVRLVVRAIDGKSPEQFIPSPGPCWPVWLDNDRLLFVSYDPRGGCALALFDRRTAQVQRKSFGLRRMFAPAPHPDGRRVALCGWGNVPDDAVIFLADLDTLQLQPGPPVADGAGAQLFPRWIGDDTLLYLQLGRERAALMRWNVGDRAARAVATLAAPPTVHDAQHILAGVTDPLSPGLTHYAAYLPAHDAVVLTDLADGDTIVTHRSTRAGAWWSDAWFIASRDDKVELVQVDHAADPPNTLKLLEGRWAPIWTDATRKSLILVGPADDPALLHVMQLWLVLEGE